MKNLTETIKEAEKTGKLKEIVSMIDWDLEWSDKDGMHYLYEDDNNSDYILSINNDSRVIVTAHHYDDAADWVRTVNTEIRAARVQALAG